ncbi:MAG: MFS transporter [Beijerinckiaceae bacterium]
MSGQKSERYFGWVVVWAAFVVAVFGWGVGFYGTPIYLKTVQDARGWSAGLVSSAVTVHFLIGAFVVANLPRLHRRFGLAAVTIGGSVVLSLGILGWSLAQAPWQLFLATLFSGAGWVALGAAGINAMVSPWFIKKRPAALSTAYNGASIGGVLFSPLWVFLIERFGFPAAALGVGVVMTGVIAVLALSALGRSPQSMGLHVDGEAASPVLDVRIPVPRVPKSAGSFGRDAAFLTLAFGMALGLFAQIGLIAHLFSLLSPALGAQAAGLAAGMATAAAILGRTLVGWFMPITADRRIIGALNYGVQALGCVALLAAAGTSIPLLLLGVFLVGLGLGNATSMPPLIAQVEFSKEEAARAFALVMAFAQAAYAFAPAIFGLLREFTDIQSLPATPLVFGAALVVQLAAAGAYLIGRKRFEQR